MDQEKASPPTGAVVRDGDENEIQGGGQLAGGASAKTNDVIDNDLELAHRLQAIEQLTSVFGFSRKVSEQAVDEVGWDVTICYNYILDQNLGQDQGGVVVPMDNCPHLGKHVSMDAIQISGMMDNGSLVDARCSHPVSHRSSKSTTAAGLKQDFHQDGSCPARENWMCLECGVIRCGRYENGHSLAHWEETKQNDAQGHCLCVSFSDFSVWCYLCSSYVNHTSLAPLEEKLRQLKFSEDKPQANTPVQPISPQNSVDYTNLSPKTAKESIQASLLAAFSPTTKSPKHKKVRRSVEMDESTDHRALSFPQSDVVTGSPESGDEVVSKSDDKRKLSKNRGTRDSANDPVQSEDDGPEYENDEEDLEDEDEEETEDEGKERMVARGVPLNFDDEEEDEDEHDYENPGDSEERDSNLMQMLARAAAAQGIPLKWLIQQVYEEENETPLEYPFETLPSDLAGVANFIQSDRCKRIVILAGAGMSVASGIPDFRSSDGLYATLKAESLTCSQQQQDAIRKDPSFALDQHLFLDNPLPLLETKRDFILGTYEQRWKATLAHRFVELLYAKTGKLVRLYTQNIDGLEDQCSQLPQEKVIAVHGTMDRAECARCKTRASFVDFCNKVRNQIKDISQKDLCAPSVSTPIACATCGFHAVKPAIVLFRSSLPPDFFENVVNDVQDVDLLLIIGTSLKVAPANSLVWRVPRSAMRVLINREMVGEHLGMDFDQGERDVFACGNCDDVLLHLMEYLGWLPDLEPLVAECKLPQSSADLLQERLAQRSAAMATNGQTNMVESSFSQIL